MEQRGRHRSTLVPGKRMTDMVVLYQAGIDDNRSYLAEKTFNDDSNNTQDLEEREWEKQGLPFKERMLRLQQKAVQKLNDAHARVEAGKRGARNFAEFLAMPDESELESDEEDVRAVRKENVFVIPALPKHLLNKQMSSPVVENRQMTGLACSTPKNSDSTMRSLRTLDISHVVSTEQMDYATVTIHETNVVIPTVKNDGSQENNESESSLQRTFVKEQGQMENLPKITEETEERQNVEELTTKESSPQPHQKTDTKDGGRATRRRSMRVNVVEQHARIAEVDISHVINTEQLDGATVTIHERDVAIPTVNNESESSLQKTFVKEQGQMENLPKITEETQERHNVEELTTKESTPQPHQKADTKDGGRETRRRSMRVNVVERQARIAEVDISHVINTEQLDGATVTVHETDVAIPTVNNESESSLQKTFVKEQGQTENLQKMTEETEEGQNAEELFRKETALPPVDESVAIVQNTIEGGRETRRRSKKVNLAEREKRIADVTSSLMSTVSDTPSPGVSFFRNVRKKIRPAVASPAVRRAVARLSTESDKEKTIEMMSVDTFVGVESAGSSYVDPVSVNESHDDEETAGTIDLIKTPKSAVPETSSRLEEPESSNLSEKSVEKVMGSNLTVVYEEPRDEGVEAISRVLETPKSTRKSTLTVNVEVEEPLIDEEGCSQRSVNEFVEDIDDELTVVNSPAHETEDPIPEPSPIVPIRSKRRGVALLSDSIATVNTPGIGPSTTRRNTEDTIADDWNSDDGDETVAPRRNVRNGIKNRGGLQLAKRKLIEPKSPSDGLRRSSRVRVKPLRTWLGEQAVYVNSPSGGKRLKGVTDVVIKDRRLCKYRTADPKLATEREQREKARKRERAAEKRRRLALDHSRGHRLNESQEDIVTSDDDN